MSFLGFPNPIPDSRIIWLFKERKVETGKDKMVWAELQRQLDAIGLRVKRGTIQDATFIEADPGSSKKPHDEGSRTRCSRDGTWAKKGKKSLKLAAAIGELRKKRTIKGYLQALEQLRLRLYGIAGAAIANSILFLEQLIIWAFLLH